MQTTRSRELDFPGFLKALQAKDRVPAWLKLKDLLQNESELVESKHIKSVISLLMNHKTREIKAPEIRMLIAEHKRRFPSLELDELEIEFYLKTGAYDKLMEFEDIKVRAMAIELLFKNRKYKLLQEFETSTDIKIINRLLRGYYGAADYQKVVALFEKNTCAANSGTYNIMILTYCKLGQQDKAFELFLSLRKYTDFLAASMLKGLIGDEKQSQQVFDIIDKHGIAYDAYLTQLLIKHTVNKNPQKALEIFLDFVKKEYPSQILIHTILEGLFKNDIDVGLEFLQFAHKSSYQITLPMYRACISALADAERPETLYLYDIIRGKKLIAPIYNIIMKYCVKTFNVETFKSVWKDMSKSKDCEFNEISFNLALQIYLQTRDIQSCLDVMKQMDAKNIIPKAEKLTEFIKMCCDARQFTEIHIALGIARKANYKLELDDILSPHTEQFEKLMAELKDKEDWSAVIGTFKMVFDKIQPPLSILEIVMKVYIEKKDLIGLVKTWTYLENHYQPSETSLLLLVEGVFKLGQSNTCDAVCKICSKHQKFKSVSSSLLALVSRYGNVEDIPGMVVEYDSLYSADRTIWQSCQRGIAGDSARTKYVREFFEKSYPELIVDNEEETD